VWQQIQDQPFVCEILKRSPEQAPLILSNQEIVGLIWQVFYLQRSDLSLEMILRTRRFCDGPQGMKKKVDLLLLEEMNLREKEIEEHPKLSQESHHKLR
jgi:hypothetical protein